MEQLIDLIQARCIKWSEPLKLDRFLRQVRIIKGVERGKDNGHADLLNATGILVSISAKGNPYDNAFIESFFKTLKAEEVYLWEYETYQDVIERISYFIEDVYNS